MYFIHTWSKSIVPSQLHKPFLGFAKRLNRLLPRSCLQAGSVVLRTWIRFYDLEQVSRSATFHKVNGVASVMRNCFVAAWSDDPCFSLALKFLNLTIQSRTEELQVRGFLLHHECAEQIIAPWS